MSGWDIFLLVLALPFAAIAHIAIFNLITKPEFDAFAVYMWNGLLLLISGFAALGITPWSLVYAVPGAAYYVWKHSKPTVGELHLKSIKEQEAREQQDRLEANAAWLETNLPTKEVFAQLLQAAFRRDTKRSIHEGYLSEIVDFVFAEIYEKDILVQRPGKVPDEIYRLYFQACLDGLLALGKLIPEQLIAQRRHEGFVEVETHFEFNKNKKPEDFDIVLGQPMFAALNGLSRAFQAHVPHLKKLGAFQHLDPIDTYPCVRAEDPGNFEGSWIDADASTRRDCENRRREYEKARTEAADSVPQCYQPFFHTPLYSYAPMFLPPHSTKPVHLSDELRFRHQWIIGATGAGKTTFISAMLKEDLKRVERGECSVFIMDSQNELLLHLSKLQIFAPGQPLHGKLIYLEPDADHPLAINPFAHDPERYAGLNNNQRTVLQRGAEDMLLFFMRSIMRAELSSHMETILKYAFRALQRIPNATIADLGNLLTKSGYARYESHLRDLDETDISFLSKEMHGTEYSASLGGLRSRIRGVAADDVFKAMFLQPRNRLNLFEQLQSAKVIVVNANGAFLGSALEPFGRFFIASLLRATEERMLIARGARLPVFAYVDEAADYIKQEEKVEQLLVKARKQNVGMIFANQFENQIENLKVKEALGRAGIQARGVAGADPEKDPPIWHIQIGAAAPKHVVVPNIDFSKEPQMRDEEYGALLTEMRDRFSVPRGGHQQTQDTSATPPPPPPPRDEASYDLEYEQIVSPAKMRAGGEQEVRVPGRGTIKIRIPPGSRYGDRIRIPGMGARKPDGTNGDIWVVLKQHPDTVDPTDAPPPRNSTTAAPQPNSLPKQDDGDMDTSAKPWP